MYRHVLELHRRRRGEPVEELMKASMQGRQDHLTLIETLGAEGQSLDDTDEEDPNVYNVRTLPRPGAAKS